MGGAGKSGGGEARVPVEAPDSMRSRAYARVLDLVCEGEIEGLVDGLRSVYLDATPVANADGSRNFTGVTLVERTGTQGQAPISGFSQTESEQSVNTEILAGTPVVRSVTNSDVDAVRVRLAFPGLSQQNLTNGDLTGTTVQVAIDVQSNGGGYIAQNIDYEWRPSPNPATRSAIGLEITTKWSYSAPYVAGFQYTARGVVQFQVQYRQVGAGTWTTLKNDAMDSSHASTGSRRAVPFGTLFEAVRTYTVGGLPSALYEARVLLSSGVGSMLLESFRILTAVPYSTITGKTTSTYQRSYHVALSGSPPWDIRVRRLTADSTSSALRNKTYWDGYTQIVETKFRYPNSAIVAVSVDSSQFSAIPTRGYDMKLLRVKIPSNYDPVTRVYTGLWDGTFVVAWTDNPAWCFYDLLTNERYGLGTYVPAAQVDKWGLYTIGQYCDGLVPDLRGHQEPRLTCNLYLQTRQEAYRVLTTMASIFRGMIYWAGGVVTAVQDAPADPVALFTEANVADGLFTYSGSSKRARHTVALVSWNDPDDGYKLKPEYVEDADGIVRYGVVQTEVVAVGCISRGQAHRVGEWLLYSERYETETVTFKTGQDAAYVRPGQIIAIQDQHRAGIRHGGRVVSSTASSVTIDQAITISAGQVYTVQVVLPDGTLVTKTLTNAPGPAATLTISVNFTTQPAVGAVWLVTATTVAPRLYRVITIAETSRHEYEVTGLAHNPSKYAAIEQDRRLETPAYSTLSPVPTSPQNVLISESLAIVAGVVTVVVTVEWEPSLHALWYQVEYRRDSGNYVTMPRTSTASIEIVPALPGFYEFRLAAINVLSASSAIATVARQIYGKTAPPANVTGFVVARTDDALAFVWTAVPDLDLEYYEIRHGTAWASAIAVGTTFATQLRVVTNNGGTYLIKAFDTSGNESLTASAVIIGANTNINVIVTANDAPTWSGVKSQTAVGSGGLTLSGSLTWADLTQPWSTYTESWIKTGTPYSSGTYETAPIDLADVMASHLEIVPVVQQLAIGVTWADLTQPWSYYTDPWTGVPGKVTATYDMALSQDGSTWAAWQTYQAGHYEFRAVKFRVTLATLDENYVPVLTSLLVTVDVPDRVIHFEDQAIDSAGTTLVFSPAFVNVPTLNVTIQEGAVGDTFRVTNKSSSQATITVYSSAGAAKAGNVDVDAVGYGSI